IAHLSAGAHTARGDAKAPAAAQEFLKAEDAETVATIKELIETRVRPAVAGDGGDITFRGYKDGVVYLAMKGSCSGCPSSTATLRHGIQHRLRHFIPAVTQGRPVRSPPSPDFAAEHALAGWAACLRPARSDRARVV